MFWILICFRKCEIVSINWAPAFHVAQMQSVLLQVLIMIWASPAQNPVNLYQACLFPLVIWPVLLLSSNLDHLYIASSSSKLMAEYSLNIHERKKKKELEDIQVVSSQVLYMWYMFLLSPSKAFCIMISVVSAWCFISGNGMKSHNNNASVFFILFNTSTEVASGYCHILSIQSNIIVWLDH